MLSMGRGRVDFLPFLSARTCVTKLECECLSLSRVIKAVEIQFSVARARSADVVGILFAFRHLVIS